MKKKLKPVKRPAKLGWYSYLGDVQGCGTIRVIQPYLLLNHFRQKDLMIHAQYGMSYVPDPSWYQVFTFVQFQRSATQGHFEIIKHFKNTVQQKFPIPTIYEIDDMLFDIPKWNYASIYYNKNEDLIKRIMSSCDAMVTSTAKLKEVYSDYNKKIAVVPNHLPKFIWGDVYPKHNYFDEEHYKDFIDSLPRAKSKEVKRLQNAGYLLYSLHTPNPSAWATGDENKVVSLVHNKELDEWDEGYMRIIRFEKDFAYLENEEGTERGPILFSKELVKVLKIGDVINVGIGLFGKHWKVLESGNVYRIPYAI